MKRIVLICLSCCYLLANGQNNIHQIEYYFNNDPGFGAGTDVPFGADAFTVTDLSFDIDVSGLTEGFNMLFVRARNDSGWSVPGVKSLYIFSAASISTPNITKIEFFVDADPGFGLGTNVTLTPATTLSDLTFAVPLSTLTEGFHTLQVRAQNANGRWSTAFIKSIYVLSASSIAVPDITEVEYFVDADPGYGLGSDVSITAGTELTDINFSIDLSTLPEGFHTLNVRAKNANGRWGDAYVKSIYVLSASSLSIPDISEVEYFMDADPGYGLGNEITISPSTTLNDVTFSIDLTGQTEGFHTLNVRAKNVDGRWGDAVVKPLFVLTSSTTSLPEITKVEYFFDADPGFGSGIVVPIIANDTITNLTFEVAIDTLDQGFHVLNVRTQNEDGEWGIAYTKPVFISTAITEAPIVALEYFFDTDPGVGSGTSISVTPSIDIADLVVGANISALVVGPHLLYIRARDANGVWSTTESYPFEACIQDAPIAGQPLGVSYDTFIANWSAAIDAVTYQVDVSTDTLTTFLPGFEAKSLSVLRDTLVGLTPLTHFQYRVRALGPDNCLSINSDTIYVRTNSTLAIDTDALIALYNATNGANWTNNTGWLSGLASDSWSGVTVVNENVVSLTLPNNNIIGPIPEDILNVSKLASVDLSGNEINAIPDFSGLPDATTVDLSDNKLDFGDLEPNLDVGGLLFLNQKKIGAMGSDTVNISNAYALSSVIGGSNNQYQWSLNGNPIAGASADTYIINSFTKEDRGVYECTITSTLIPELILKTNPRTAVGVATVSGTLFASTNVPASEGTVQLLKITTGGYDSIPATPLPINSDGTFTLEKIILDDYLLVGLADTLVYERALPTYVPNTAYWEEADTISLQENITGLEILSVLEPLDQLTGEGLLLGFVQEDDGTGRVEKTRRVGGAGVSARRVQGTGRGNETFEIVAYVFTNEEGEFSIAGFPPGDYRFNVQYPGYPMDETSFIDFTIGTNALEETVQVEATVENEKITVRELVITHIGSPEWNVQVFPNPGSEIITVQFEDVNTTRYMVLLDPHGRPVIRQSAAELKTNMNFSTLPVGVYLLSIRTATGREKLVRVVKN